MKVVDPGHEYDLNWLDGEPRMWLNGTAKWNRQTQTWESQDTQSENRLVFVKREGEGYPGNVGRHPGTTSQDVMRALIDRAKYVDAQVPDLRNKAVIANLRHSIWLLEQRAAERHGRAFPFSWWEIELAPMCAECGHAGCEGKCRATHSFSETAAPAAPPEWSHERMQAFVAEAQEHLSGGRTAAAARMFKYLEGDY